MVFPAQTPPDVAGYVEFSLAHGFHAAGDDQIGIACLDFHGSVEDGVQPRTAAPVHHDPRNGVRPSRIKHGHARSVGALAVLVG